MTRDIRKDKTTEAASVIGVLRGLAPDRRLSVSEARRVAELQATQLLLAARVREVPIPSEVISCQTRVIVEHDFDMPDSASGACNWDEAAKRWVITINAHHPETRQRFTLLHEYKHILDHGQPVLIEKTSERYDQPAAEYIADYFAACVLMPRTLVIRTWNTGSQTAGELARRFDVSERAMELRLLELKLSDQGSSGRREAA